MKQSKLLRKQADMMDMAEKYGVSRWQTLVQYRSVVKVDEWKTTIICSTLEIPLATELEYRFALGVVEGKPVFEGDLLYRVDTGEPCRINIAAGFLCERFSWNPPKPKTVMVEMSYELAEYYSKLNVSMSPSVVSDVAQACRKAIEEKK